MNLELIAQIHGKDDKLASFIKELNFMGETTLTLLVVGLAVCIGLEIYYSHKGNYSYQSRYITQRNQHL